MSTINRLKFPSGRSVIRAKQDAKALAKLKKIPLHQALDEVSKTNGSIGNWSQALAKLQNESKLPAIKPSAFSKTDMNPYRKLLVLGLNEILSKGLLSLNWDGDSREPTSHIETIIAGHNSIVSWADAGFGEVRISVWWKYDHSKHPQANLKGNSQETFSNQSPLAKRQHYRKFVGVVCSAWLERDTGKYLQGNGNDHLLEKYTRKGELEYLKHLPNPSPQGFEPEGRFHM